MPSYAVGMQMAATARQRTFCGTVRTRFLVCHKCHLPVFATMAASAEGVGRDTDRRLGNAGAGRFII